MDKMVKNALFNSIFSGKKVFLTGHTGFKGSWLALWLTQMGAIVKGYSLAPNTSPSHWELLNLDIESIYADIRDRKTLEKELLSFQPDIVFHLAAQPLVRASYANPFETYETNVIGTMALYEACRKTDSIKAIISISTDKCYENKEWLWGYRENDILGGYDPYSSSKACAELMTSSYRRSFFNINEYGKTHNVLLATVRAGNVIGGGDWAPDRLIPDIMKAAAIGKSVHIRNPKATRPWQHVLEPLSGYLLLGQHLLNGEKSFADAWNFGPDYKSNQSVKDVSFYLKKEWDNIITEFNIGISEFHEATLLMLDCTKAKELLKWNPVWNNQVFSKTAEWYKEYYTNSKLLSLEQLDEYITDAKKCNSIWSN
ncbi:MAG: CDP-glucose 4,6-dehydratase [Bacteroidia bacterium]|nr:CDP-glucose 4,6-dehydratase [Bacteroidia bacterium]